jgi:membrane protease YdiL (CAAX protease family)
MFTHLSFLAEIVPQTGVFWDYSNPPGGTVLAGLLFLLILTTGVVLDFGLVVYSVKRPPCLAQWHENLKQRALPGRLILILVLTLVAFYAACSLAYSVLYPDVYEVEPQTLVFQGLFFNLPALIIIAGIFMHRRVSGREHDHVSWRRAPSMLGLSVLLYLAAIPLLWFYSMLYQFFLYRLGFDFHLQEVAQIFMQPASPLVRAAMYFTAVILAPVFEEFLFRGILLPWVVRRTGLRTGIIIISFVFAAIHFHLPSFLPLFLLSCFFCAAYARTRSLLVPIGMHACFNAVTIILLALTGG